MTTIQLLGCFRVATYISYTSHSYTYMHIKIEQNYFQKYFNSVYLYNFSSYLDIFSLDNDSFDYRNLDYLNRLDHRKILMFYLTNYA